MQKPIFRIRECKDIIYTVDTNFCRINEDDSFCYLTEISVPLISIAEKITATNITIFGTTEDWFRPERIEIENEELAIINNTGWQRTENMLPKFTNVLIIEARHSGNKISPDDYKLIECSSEAKTLEKEIVHAVFKEVIPLVSDKKHSEEKLQLTISKLSDNKLYRKFRNYKHEKNITTSKALRELLNFAFLCLKQGLRMNEHGQLIEVSQFSHLKKQGIDISGSNNGNQLSKLNEIRGNTIQALTSCKYAINVDILNNFPYDMPVENFKDRSFDEFMQKLKINEYVPYEVIKYCVSDVNKQYFDGKLTYDGEQVLCELINLSYKLHQLQK